MRHFLHLLSHALHRGYEAYQERAQMRLAPIQPPRSWHDIPHAGAGCHRG